MANIPWKELGAAALALGKKGAEIVKEDKEVQSLLFGRYADGSPRSLADAIDGEVVSPEDKLLIEKRIKKHKKKKKKKEAKGEKYGKIDVSKL